MNNQQRELKKANELPLGAWFRVLLFGKVKSPATGQLLKFTDATSRLLTPILVLVPVLFVVVFFSAVVEPTLANVLLFLAALVGLVLIALRRAGLEKVKNGELRE